MFIFLIFHLLFFLYFDGFYFSINFAPFLLSLFFKINCYLRIIFFTCFSWNLPLRLILFYFFVVSISHDFRRQLFLLLLFCVVVFICFVFASFPLYFFVVYTSFSAIFALLFSQWIFDFSTKSLLLLLLLFPKQEQVAAIDLLSPAAFIFPISVWFCCWRMKVVSFFNFMWNYS